MSVAGQRRGSIPSLEPGQAVARCVGSPASSPGLSGSHRQPVCLLCSGPVLNPIVCVIRTRHVLISTFQMQHKGPGTRSDVSKAGAALTGRC